MIVHYLVQGVDSVFPFFWFYFSCCSTSSWNLQKHLPKNMYAWFQAFYIPVSINSLNFLNVLWHCLTEFFLTISRDCRAVLVRDEDECSSSGKSPKCLRFTETNFGTDEDIKRNSKYDPHDSYFFEQYDTLLFQGNGVERTDCTVKSPKGVKDSLARGEGGRCNYDVCAMTLH